MDLGRLKGDAEKKAFWINLYNGITNYVIIEYKIQQSLLERGNIFKKKVFSIAGLEYSLNDVEHGILRINERDTFALDDPKRAYMVDKLDYRIHFALNCGAKSCPLIAFYSAENIEAELAEAEAVFLKNNFIVNLEQKKIVASKLFEWYRKDFDKLFLDNPVYQSFDIIFQEYDWSI